MSYSEFMDDMDSVEINEAIAVSGIGGMKVYHDGNEIDMVDWIWENNKKVGFKIIRG